jgi:hypothetical protein
VKKRRRQGALVPLLFFVLITGTVLALVVIEARNYISAPVAQHFPAPAGSGVLTLYHRTQRARAADVFWQPHGAGIRAVAPLFYAGEDRAGRPRQRFEELRWSRDGASVFAVAPDGSVLWLYDTATDVLLPGARAAAALASSGGEGGLITRWYELGEATPEGRLWSWETTRYEKALRHPGGRR